MLSEPPKNGPDGQLQLHASTVVIGNKAVAICGPSGSGKSALALELLSLGATLLADDITWLNATTSGLLATCPPSISGQIEARGVGILSATPADPTPLHLVVDLGTPEPDRLPKPKTITLLDHKVALLHTPASRHFAQAIAHYMMHGRAT
ncbi:HPr kinase/phosphorylase [Octadecabacter ascidiaceicola]|uniref:HPr kinase/phosphorylase n=1 Tax=Octadecabacter ascidiaceicola TaxID=1655543 RepID=A0A238KA43_9RHOB|nr:serine/threonine protein kinase [Octadecabacter ascidiaceicola]SMX39771.1 HPr kinase/phosphorylase [Octadecabacter ascidiaceicola]